MGQPHKAPTWIWPTLWAGSIFVTSSGYLTTDQLAHAVTAASGNRIGIDGFRHFWGLVWWMFVKGWHATEFAALLILLRRWIASPKLALGLALAAGALDEFHQLFVPHRGCRLSDVMIDWVGVAAVLLWGQWSAYRKTGVKTWPARPIKFALAATMLALAVFLLSFFPFGLVELQPASGVRP